MTELEEELQAAAENQRQAQLAAQDAERRLEDERAALKDRVSSALAEAQRQMDAEHERISSELSQAKEQLKTMRRGESAPPDSTRVLDRATAEIQELRRKLEEADKQRQAAERNADRLVQSERQRAAEEVRQNKEMLDAQRHQLEQERAAAPGEVERRVADERRQAQERAEILRQQYEQERAALYQELNQLRQSAAARTQPVGDDRRTHLDAFWAMEAGRGEGRSQEEFAPRPAMNRAASDNGGALPPDVQAWAAAGLNAEVERLTRQLGGESVPEQSAASRRLDAIGPAALTPLAAAANSADAVVRRGTGRALLLLGEKFKKAGQLAQAKESYRLALPLLGRIIHEEPGVAEYRWRLADCHFSFGSLASGPNQLQEAEESYRKAAELSERLTLDFPDVPHYRRALALSHNNLGIILARTNHNQEAEECFTGALKHQEKLLAEQPAQSLYKFDLALTYLNWGTLLANTDRASQAEDAYRRAKGLGEHLMAEQPQSAEFRNILATATNNLAKLAQKKQTASG